MGTETKGAIDKEITSHDVYEIIKYSIDPMVKNLTKNDNLYVNDEYFYFSIGSIVFDYRNQRHSVFYCVTKDKVNEDKEMKAHLIMGFSKYSVEIMQKIVSYFGGYILENDSSSDRYYYVEKNSDIDQINENIKQRKELAKGLNLKNENEANRIASIILENKEIIKKYLI